MYCLSVYVLSLCASLQSIHSNGVATESKPAVKRNQKTGKKPGTKSRKEGSKKTHNSTGKTAFHNNMKTRLLPPTSPTGTLLADLPNIYMILRSNNDKALKEM